MVEGSILVDEHRLRITAQLIDAAEDTHVWARTYATGLGDALTIQRAIARDIADRLGSGLEQPGSERVSREVDPDAVMQYLRGRFHWYKLNPAHFPKALEYFEKAVAISPDFGAAYAGIADVWGAFGYWGVLPAAEAAGHVRAALERAEAVEPDGPEVNMLFGAYHFFVEYDWDAARRRLERAIRLNADLAHSRLLLALLRATLREPGVFDEIDQARRLDPLNPAVMLARAMCLAGDRRYAASKSEIELMLEVEPSFQPAFELGAELAWAEGAGDAISWERRVWQADEEVLALLEASAGDSNPTEALLAVARLLERRSEERYVSPRVVARLYALAGQPRIAIDVLDAAVARNDLMQVDFVQLMPAFAAVRQHRRYASLARAIGLPAASVPT